MAEPTDLGTSAASKERRLESWGEIAAYLRREIRTVQRWEKTLGLPIHRLNVGRNSAVYAYPSELDKWYQGREPQDVKEDDFTEELAAEPNGASPPPADSSTKSVPAIVPPSQTAIPFYRRKSAWLAGIAFMVMFGILVARAIIPSPPISVPTST